MTSLENEALYTSVQQYDGVDQTSKVIAAQIDPRLGLEMRGEERMAYWRSVTARLLEDVEGCIGPVCIPTMILARGQEMRNTVFLSILEEMVASAREVCQQRDVGGTERRPYRSVVKLEVIRSWLPRADAGAVERMREAYSKNCTGPYDENRHAWACSALKGYGEMILRENATPDEL